MQIQTIRTYDTPQYTTTSTLEGSTFILSFWYHQREQSWYLSIADASGLDIVNGVKLVCKAFLLAKCVDPRRPPGELYVDDPTGDLSPPGLEDLLPSGRCTLCYLTADLVTALRTGDTASVGAFASSLRTNTATGAGPSTYGQE